jgi:hypothetical protein
MADNDTPLTPEQEAALAAEAQAHTVSQPNPASEQAATAAAMSQRGPLLPAEEDMEKMMAAIKAQSEQIAALQGQLGTMAKQQEEALAANGGPLPTRYATAVADKVTATVAAHPDAPDGHFAPLVEASGKLKEAAAAVVKGGGAVADVESAAGAVSRFLDKTHIKTWAKHIDWSAMADDLEAVVTEAAKLVG